MIKISFLALSAIVAGGSAVAQTKAIYHPASAGTAFAGRHNTLPLGNVISVTRYQQIHSALGGVHILTSMAWRRGPARTWTGTTNKGGSATLGLTLALSDTSKVSATWSKNYAGPATLVMKTRKISLPDTQAAPGTGKLAPWNVLFPFDTTWTYNGTKDLCTDMNITSVPNTIYFCDSASFYQEAPAVNYGTSCTASGQTRAMLQQVFVRNRPWNNDLQWSGRIFYGPKGASAGIAVGFQRTNTTVGNWCTKLYTNPQLFWLGKTDSTNNGVFQVPGPPNFWTVEKWNPALTGLRLYAQGFAADSTAPNGIVLTQGVQTTIPAISTSKELGIRLWGSTSATVDVGSTLATCFFKK